MSANRSVRIDGLTDETADQWRWLQHTTELLIADLFTEMVDERYTAERVALAKRLAEEA